MKRVTEEYAAIQMAEHLRFLVIGGQTVGGAIKANGTDFVYSDAAWNYKFNSNQLSCCDCFASITERTKYAYDLPKLV